MNVIDLKITFELRYTTGEAERASSFITSPSGRWASTRRMFEKSAGPPCCKTLILHCVWRNVYGPSHELSYWVAFCNVLKEITEKGSNLEHLEVWVPKTDKQRLSVDAIKVADAVPVRGSGGWSGQQQDALERG